MTISAVILGGGCGLVNPSDKRKTATLLKTQTATQAQLLEKVNHLSQVGSMRAKMDLRFEDNSFAEVGIAEKYKTADGEIIVQRPANISLKVQVPFFKSDVAEMTSDGEKFRVAVLVDTDGGKYKKFVTGSNGADYSRLQEAVSRMDLNGGSKTAKQNVNAFANLRPQHFTEALLVRPADAAQYMYAQSEMFQDEPADSSGDKKSTTRVIRGYYILDEFAKNEDGGLKIMRRFWFDRVGIVRLARQQIFDAQGLIESDIVYGNEGNLSDNAQYRNLPQRIEVTRPKEKYKMSLTYQAAGSVTIGRSYPKDVFLLQNRWNLPEVDLDKELSNRQATTGN